MPFVFVHTVDIGVHCEGYRVVTEDGRQCFVVHAALQRTSGKGMPQGVEGKVPDVGIFQQAVIVILESFLLKVVSKLVGDNEAIVGVLIPVRILSCSCCFFQRVSSSTIVRVSGIVRREFFVFGCTEYDFGFVFAVVGFVLGKAVDGTPDVKLGGGKVDVLPLQRQQLPPCVTLYTGLSG